MKPTTWLVVAVTGLSALSTGSPVWAQSAGHGPAVVELPASTRALALGDAFQLDAGDSDVLFYNPGLLGAAGGMMLGYHRFGDQSTAFTLSAATGWWGGAVGAGIQTLEYTTDAPPGGRPAGIDPFVTSGGTVVSEQVATVGYARSVGPVELGLAAKLIDQRHGDDRETSGAADIGVATRVGGFRMGLAARNLGPETDLGPGADVGSPERFTLGAGRYGLRLGPLDLGLAAAVSHRADGEWIAGGGVEVGYWPVIGRTFVVRAGARNVPDGEALPVTVGGSYWGDDLVLEYAFQPVDDHDGIHRLSVGWR